MDDTLDSQCAAIQACCNHFNLRRRRDWIKWHTVLLSLSLYPATTW